MKLFGLTAVSAVTLAVPGIALQNGGYLSSLNGAGTASTPSANFFPAPSQSMGSPSGAFVATTRPNIPNMLLPSEELLSLWSSQVSVELSASQLYLSASIWFRNLGYDGMAAWMLEESDEERGHGLAILEFAMKKDFPVVLEPLEAPKNDWQTPEEVWESILLAEQTNTQNLLRLADAANKCGDFAAVAFLNPFHMEQLDAEHKVGGILNNVRGASAEFLKQLDIELGEEEDGH